MDAVWRSRIAAPSPLANHTTSRPRIGTPKHSNAILNNQTHKITDRWTRELNDRGVRLDLDTRKQPETLMKVDPSYLTAARDEMVALSGSVDAYTRD